MAAIPILSPTTQTSSIYSDYWPFSDETTGIIKQIALGALAGILFLPLNIGMVYGIKILLKYYGINAEIDPKRLAEIRSAWKTSSFFFKAFAVSYIAIIAPVMEEVAFRWGLDETLQTVVQTWLPSPESTIYKVLCIVANGIIFGLFHFSPAAWTSVPRVVAMTILGCICMILKESTDDLTAPIAMHMTNNIGAIGLSLRAMAS